MNLNALIFIQFLMNLKLFQPAFIPYKLNTSLIFFKQPHDCVQIKIYTGVGPLSYYDCVTLPDETKYHQTVDALGYLTFTHLDHGSKSHLSYHRSFFTLKRDETSTLICISS